MGGSDTADRDPLAVLPGNGDTAEAGTATEGITVRYRGIAGLFATLPVVVFAVITWSPLGSATGLTTLVVASLVIPLVISVASTIGLSALGGYLGATAC